MEVKFTVRYEARLSEYRPCVATVTLRLPEGGEWVNPQARVLERHLNPAWGVRTPDGAWREAEIEIDASTWDELNDRVRSLINTSVQRLREIVSRNRELLSTVPSTREEVFTI